MTTVRSVATGGITRVAAVTEPARRSVLAANLMARVIDVRVIEGQRVEAGTPLVRLDVRDLVARRGQAQAAAAANRAQAELATSGMQRARVLEDMGAVAAQHREAADTNATALEAAVEGAQSALRELDIRLGESVLRAPFDGVIVQKHTDLGSFAAPGQPLLVIEDDSMLRVVAPVAASDAARLVEGSSHEITLATGEQVQGILDSVVSSGNPRSPGLGALFVVPNEGHRLRTGVVASVAIPALPMSSATFEVPESALVERGGLRGVFLVREGRAELVWCSIDARVRSGRVTVLDGLRERDVVVADASVEGLRDGRRVVAHR